MLPLLAALGLAAAPAPTTIPLPTYGTAGARQVRVVVDGDTVPFLFDTGGGVTAITPALAARLGCVPGGRFVGFRMTGERIDAPMCRAVALDVGGVRVVTDVVVLDLAGAPGATTATPLAGMVSLHTFAGRALTLDSAGARLTIETPASLAARTRALSPVRARVATGLSGGEVVAFVGAESSSGTLWLEWDSGHHGTTFVAPHAAVALRLADTTAGAGDDASLALGGAGRIAVPVEVKAIVHDGVLSAATIERAAWTIDLATGRMWVGGVRALFAPPATARSADALAADAPARAPAGWYDVALVVNGARQRAYLRVTHDGDGLAGRLRFVGGDQLFELRDVRSTAAGLTFALPMRRTYPVSIAFDGAVGVGTWGTPGDGPGGAVEARRRR